MGFAIALAAPTPSDAAEIRVLTGSAMSHVLTELADAFQRTSEHKIITVILAVPNEIRRRIIDGKIVDDVMSGSATIDGLVQQGKIAPGERLILLAWVLAWQFTRGRTSRTSALSKRSGGVHSNRGGLA